MRMDIGDENVPIEQLRPLIMERLPDDLRNEEGIDELSLIHI